MWGRQYWGGGRRPSGGGGGVVVMFAWLSSQERQVRAYVELYAALGWACLVCHSEFLTLCVSLSLPLFLHLGNFAWLWICFVFFLFVSWIFGGSWGSVSGAWMWENDLDDSTMILYRRARK